MKVTTISASVRYSRAINTGEYKTIELSAEAALDPNETWTEAQASLYAELGQQLKALWTTKNGQTTNGGEHSEHYCQEHQAEFKRYEKECESGMRIRRGASGVRKSRLHAGDSRPWGLFPGAFVLIKVKLIKKEQLFDWNIQRQR